MPMPLADCRHIAVIDTETNFFDQVMSIGTVIADAVTFEPLETQYLIINPECQRGAMYDYALDHPRAVHQEFTNRKMAIVDLQQLLDKHDVKNIFAYNAVFDCNHLPEMHAYEWFDIMKVAANKKYNPKITERMECCKNGRLKRGYDVETIYRMLSDNRRYYEVHNALCDAEDELEIMRMLNCKIEEYSFAKVTRKKEREVSSSVPRLDWEWLRDYHYGWR